MSDTEAVTPTVPVWAESDPYPSLLDVVRHRRSVRKFEPGRRVPRETLIKIMEAGRWAPSGANAQHWDFICVDEDDTRARVREVFLRQGARLRQSVEPFPAVNKSFLANTVAIILVLGDERFKACFPQGVGDAHDEYTANNENIFFCSLGAAIQNIQLATIACGLTSAWLSGGGEDQTARELREILHFPLSARPYGTIPIGYPARYPDSKWRRPLDADDPLERIHRRSVSPAATGRSLRPRCAPVRDVPPHLSAWRNGTMSKQRAGAFQAAYTGRVTNPGGVLPDSEVPRDDRNRV